MQNPLLRLDFFNNFHPLAKQIQANKDFVCDWIIDKAGLSTREMDIDEKTTQNIFINKFRDVKDELTREQIVNQITTFFGAAIETISTSTANCLLLLAMHPEIQQKLYDEIIRVLPDPDNANITNEKLNEMQYLEQVMHEAMRLLPIIPLIGRQATEDFELAPGATIVEGTNISINLFYLFRRKDVWGENAEQFVPERFAPENVKKDQLFIPFGNGKRNCIGYRFAYSGFKLIIMKAVRNFHITTDLKFNDLKLERKIALKIIGEHSISIKPRKVM